MIFELCKGKTNCKKCKNPMNKGEIRGKYGEGWYNDPYLYYCLNCCMKDGTIDINSLIKVYKIKIKECNSIIKKLQNWKKMVTQKKLQKIKKWRKLIK